VIDIARSCNRYRPLLVDFVDHGEVRPETAAALAHLDRCDRCTDAIEGTMRTITALRRLGEATLAFEPQAEAWPRLRSRLQAAKPRRPAIMSPLAGVAMSFAIVAVLVVPFGLGGGTLLGPAASPTIERSSAINPADRRIEAAYIAAVHQSSLGPNGGLESSLQLAGNYPRIYPDNDRTIRKEVTSEQPYRRAPEAI
jgi:anti-sigma factor RsiW